VTTTPLVEHHVLEYPGGYTRSVGPALSAFFTGLRDGKLVGVRRADGTVMIPPTEYDPVTAEPLTEFVEVGPAGTVTACTWVAEPKPNKHPLDKPFAFALIKPDGADTAMLHAVAVDSPDAISIGTRVAPRWRSERKGYITDIEAFVPLADGATPEPAPANTAEDATDEPVTGITVPIRLEYEINAGRAASMYLHGMEERKIIGAHAEGSDEVYVPPRGSDPTTGAPTTVQVEVGQNGTVTTFCVVNLPGLSEQAPEVPYVCAQILLDGGNTPWFGLVQGLAADDVRAGLRVKAVWVDEPTPDARSIKWFEPNGEPDAAYDTFKDYA
jgi:uncharacterized OB-fold protein